MRVKYDVDTQLLFQIGDPLDHACACTIHNRMYELANLNAVNLNVVVKKGELPAFIQSCKQLGVKGFDITMPHKSDIIPLCDEVEPFSREFNCVNHVKIRDGKLIGVGLDGLGMVMAIEDSGFPIYGSKVLMLGAGAVSGPIAAELCQRGASSVVILNRTVSKAEKITISLKKYFPTLQATAMSMTLENLCSCAPEADLVVQCTSLGMSGHQDDYEDLTFIDLLPKDACVADVIFNPERTSILARAEARGLRVLNGMGMLVNQEKAMMKFHFGVDLGPEFALEGEETLLMALVMRQLRTRRLTRKGASK
ncbi:Shikimate dehydrogenase [uncultured Flavonifractor sp.]|nr:Shikimate dehydrogenase [uncultured Flavonifractor sp.]